MFLAAGHRGRAGGRPGPRRGTAEGFVTGFRDMAFSAMLVGFARAIFVVLEQGHIVDTIVQGLATPLAHLPVGGGRPGHDGCASRPAPARAQRAAARPRSPCRCSYRYPTSSACSRQVTVLAFQYGAGSR
ncbi:MAG: hypothetical protein WKG07_35220 [Hymenobacter sp.]